MRLEADNSFDRLKFQLQGGCLVRRIGNSPSPPRQVLDAGEVSRTNVNSNTDAICETVSSPKIPRNAETKTAATDPTAKNSSSIPNYRSYQAKGKTSELKMGSITLAADLLAKVPRAGEEKEFDKLNEATNVQDLKQLQGHESGNVMMDRLHQARRFTTERETLIKG